MVKPGLPTTADLYVLPLDDNPATKGNKFVDKVTFLTSLLLRVISKLSGMRCDTKGKNKMRWMHDLVWLVLSQSHWRKENKNSRNNSHGDRSFRALLVFIMSDNIDIIKHFHVRKHASILSAFIM